MLWLRAVLFSRHMRKKISPLSPPLFHSTVIIIFKYIPGATRKKPKGVEFVCLFVQKGESMRSLFLLISPLADEVCARHLLTISTSQTPLPPLPAFARAHSLDCFHMAMGLALDPFFPSFSFLFTLSPMRFAPDT